MTANRPFGVSLLTVLHLVQAAFLLLVGLVLVIVGEALQRVTSAVPHFMRGFLPVVGFIIIIVAVLDLGLAYGLWIAKSWAWIVSLVLAVLRIIGALIVLVRGAFGPIVTLILDVAIVYYLNRSNVKAYFTEGKKSTLQQ